MIEARLGERLLEPGRRPLRPTDLGRALAARGARVAEARAAAEDLARRGRPGRSGIVRMAGTPIFTDGVIVAMVAAFQRALPDAARRAGLRLRGGTLDLAICPLRAEAVPKDLAFTPILPGRDVIACRPGHPLAHRPSITRDDIAGHPWIAPPAESPLHGDPRRAPAAMGRATCAWASAAARSPRCWRSWRARTR